MRPLLILLLLAAARALALAAQTPEAASRAIAAIHRCARDYVWDTEARVEPPMRRAHADYPGDLAQLGPQGTRCLDAELSRGIAGGWRILYHPLIDSTGRATGYELRASSAQFPGHSSLEFFSAVHAPEGTPTNPIDRNAIVHVRTDGQPATEADSVYGSPLPNIRRLLDCMRTPDDPKHSWVLELEEVKTCVPPNAFDIRPDTDFAGRSSARTWGPGFDYTIIYSPVWVPGACDDPGEDCGRGIADIQLDVRPTHYGVTGIRSYYIYDRGVVSADWENPVTVPTGRALPICEIWTGTTCGASVRWPRLDSPPARAHRARTRSRPTPTRTPASVSCSDDRNGRTRATPIRSQTTPIRSRAMPIRSRAMPIRSRATRTRTRATPIRSHATRAWFDETVVRVRATPECADDSLIGVRATPTRTLATRAWSDHPDACIRATRICARANASWLDHRDGRFRPTPIRIRAMRTRIRPTRTCTPRTRARSGDRDARTPPTRARSDDRDACTPRTPTPAHDFDIPIRAFLTPMRESGRRSGYCRSASAVSRSARRRTPRADTD